MSLAKSPKVSSNSFAMMIRTLEKPMCKKKKKKGIEKKDNKRRKNGVGGH